MSAEKGPLLPPGTCLAHYRVAEVLGEGAMGTVYLAHDTALDRPVAVKVVRPEIAGDPAVVQRFVREARAAARVNHPNLAHIYYVGTGAHVGTGAPPADDGSLPPFFAMEFLPGKDLEARVRERGPLSLEEAVDVLVQSAEALSAAHRAGVVHRDVKPSNLILLPDGRVKVTDFGLAKSGGLAVGDPRATGVGTLVGTPTFMSPEQCFGRDVDARSDVYALGLTAWFLLVGRPPFDGPAVGAVLDDQIHAPLPSVASARPGIPESVDRVLARLCAKDVGARPADMEEAIALLESVRPRPVQPAPPAARIAALAIDALAVTVVAGALSSVYQWLRGAVGPLFLLDVLHDLTMCAVGAASQWGMERWKGASLGKILLNLRVVREDGAVPEDRALALRFVLRWPIFLAFLVPRAGGVLSAARKVLEFAQLAAFAGGAGTYVVTKGRTLSDVVTRTRVAYRFNRPPGGRSVPSAPATVS